MAKHGSWDAPAGVSVGIQDRSLLMRGIPKGASPLCVVVGVGFIGEGPHRKGPAPMRAFAYFSHERKVGRGPGLKAPKAIK